MARLLGSIPGGEAAAEDWVRQLVLRVAIGDNDLHAKNVSLLHLPGGTRLAPVYDAVPNFFQEGLVTWDMALAVDGVFDHRRMSVERLVAETVSWGVLPIGPGPGLVGETVNDLAAVLDSVPVPDGVSPRMADHVRRNVDRLRTGYEIGEP